MNQQNEQQALLEKRIKNLEEQLAEKDDAYFELSATVATIQAEADIQVRNVAQESKLELIKTQEELRRATREANQAHATLARFQQQRHQQHQQNQQHQQQLPQESTAGTNPPPAILVQTASLEPEKKCNVSASSVLAQHLLKHCGPNRFKFDDADDTVHNFLQQCQYNDALGEEEIIWFILRYSIQLSNDGSHSIASTKKWLKDALMLSPSSRSLLRQACSSDLHKEVDAADSKEISRINVDFDFQGVSNLLKSPILKPMLKHTNGSDHPSTSNPFDASICEDWMRQICGTPDDWSLVSTVLCDSTDAESDIWYTLLTKDLKEKWEIFTKERLGENHVRRIHPLSCATQCAAPISEAAFLNSLHLLTRQVESKRRAFFDKSVMAILLDLIEYELDDREPEKTGEASLSLLSSIFWYIGKAFDLKMLRTRMQTTTEDFLAPSGLAVAICVMTMSHREVQEVVERQQEDGFYFDEESTHDMKPSSGWKVLRNHTIRLFHQVLRHVQISRVQLGDEKGICFSSLLHERRHDYLGTCSQIMFLSSIEKEDKAIAAMIQLQLEEIEDDREEEESIKLHQK